jgi:CRISPR-associated protein Cas2
MEALLMFVILTYDVGEKRVGKVLKICRKYLLHVQKSVFEGKTTEAKLLRLKEELEKVMNSDEDTLKIYKFRSLKYASVEMFGQSESASLIV